MEILSEKDLLVKLSFNLVLMLFMKAFLLISLFLSLSAFAQIDVGGLPGTVNQVEKDPAQKGFEKEYEELQEVMRDLEQEEPLEETERDEPLHHKQDEPYE